MCLEGMELQGSKSRIAELCLTIKRASAVASDILKWRCWGSLGVGKKLGHQAVGGVSRLNDTGTGDERRVFSDCIFMP